MQDGMLNQFLRLKVLLGILLVIVEVLRLWAIYRCGLDWVLESKAGKLQIDSNFNQFT